MLFIDIDMHFILDKEKLPFLTWHPSGLTPWCAPPLQQDKLPVTPVSVGSDSMTPVRCVRDLGIFIDSDMSMRTRFKDSGQVLCVPSVSTKYPTIG